MGEGSEEDDKESIKNNRQGRDEMKVTKRQLKRIIREEKSRLFNEQNVWAREESASALLSFARAYSGIGAAVQEQTDAVVAAYLDGGSYDPDAEFRDVVYEQNPNAIEAAYNTLREPLRILGDENAGDVLDALEEAMNIIRQGDAEVAADRAAAEGETSTLYSPGIDDGVE